MLILRMKKTMQKQKMHLYFLKNEKKNFFWKNFEIVFDFFWQSRNGGEFTQFVSETKSWNSEDHESWNHEMWGSPVLLNQQNTVKSIEIVPRGEPPFWLMESLFWLMKSRGGPPFGWWNLEVEPLWLMKKI